MDYFSFYRIKICTLFMTVNLFATQFGWANYSFTSHFQKSELSQGQFSKTPRNDLEKNLHKCVQNLCGELPSDQTYKAYYEAVSSQTTKSVFYDDEIAPILEKQLQVGISQLDEAKAFRDALSQVETDIPLNDQQRLAIAQFMAARLIWGRETPVVPEYVHVGAAEFGFNMSYWIGNKYDEKRFEELVKNNHFHPEDGPLLKRYIENRNLESIYPFLAPGQNQFSSLLNTHGKGAKSLLINALTDIRDSYQNRRIYPFPSFLFDRSQEAIANLQFVSKNFDTLVKLSTFSGFDPEFSTFIFQSKRMNEFVRIAGPLISPDSPNIAIPKKVKKEEFATVKGYLDSQIDTEEEYLSSDAFNKMISKTCRWKINHLYEALPTEDEIRVADRKVTQAIVKFQSWLFENFSEETATSVFDFLRSWQFIYPPSKKEYATFLKNFFKSKRKNWTLSTKKEELPAYVHILHKLPWLLSPNFNGLEKIERFCKTLKLKPIGDNAETTKGQVYLGWMTLRNYSLLESVVWHELGHILASLMKGENKENLIPTLLGIQKDFSISPDSFTKYFSSMQCLGSSQTQLKSTKVLGEPHTTWFEEGYFDIFKSSNPFYSEWKKMPDDTFQIGDMQLGPVTLSEIFPWIYPDDSFYSNESKKTLLYIDGEFVDEDWADLVAGHLSKGKSNPFCFILKDQDYLFWNEKKGMKNKDIPGIQSYNNMYDEENNPLPELTESDMETFNGKHPKHSTLFYRLLHVETVRSGILPPSCQRAKKLNPEFSQIRKCDYF